MRWTRIATWTLASSGLWMAACHKLPAFSEDGAWLSQAPGGGLVADAESPLPDVPVPIGFVALEARSVGYVTRDGVRMVRHVYQGRAEMVEAVEFYRQELERRGWKRRHEDNTGNISALHYRKGPETLLVRINSRYSVLTIRLNIDPVESSYDRRHLSRPASYTEGR